MKRVIWIGILFFLCKDILAQEPVTFSSCPGVLINGVCWAKSNVNAPGTFASTPEAWGMSYQWNRKKGWPPNEYAKGEENITGDCWEAVNVPCPPGWRVPSGEEIKTLLDEENVAWVFEKKKGYEFSDKNTGNRIFFPLAESFNAGSGITIYWSSTSYDEDLAWGLLIYYHIPIAEYNVMGKHMGFPVRCVADWNVPECEEIKRDTSVTICAKDLPYDFCDTTFEEGTMSGTYVFQRIQALTGCDSIVILKLTVKPECNKPCPGVLLNGVCWAKSNVDKPGTFASTPEAFGMLYQWNRKKAWAHNTDTTGWDDTDAGGDYWDANNDPCPYGWRVPTQEELNSIKGCNVREEYVWKITDPTTGKSMIIPYTPTREYYGTYHRLFAWFYWVNSAYDNDEAFAATTVPYIRATTLPKKWALPVRCVADWNVPECKEIKRDTSVTICAKDLPYDFCDTVFQEGTVSGTYVFQRIQALTGCDSIVTLNLTVTSECDKPCPGVLINGVCWAEFNVDAPGRFANAAKPYGMLYQWNRKKGWSPTESVTGWDNSFPIGDKWETENDPCPKGWRVPTGKEIETLTDKSKVDHVIDAWQNGIEGQLVKDKINGNTIFLPNAPFRESDANLNIRGSGCFWSSTSVSDEYARYLLISNIAPFPLSGKKNFGFSVRCVADWNVPECKPIERDTSVTICAKDLPYDFCDTVFQEGTVSGTYVFQRIQALTGCDSIVTLNLTVTSECDKPCPGVLINGVCWAKFNVDEPGTFANPQKPYGMLYQWNRKKGWPIKGSVTGWEDSVDPAENWEPDNDPCPAGWRMPTLEEMNALVDEAKVTYTETTQDGFWGARFEDNFTGTAIFFPAVGFRYGAETTSDYRVYYWTGTSNQLMERGFIHSAREDASGYSVRCVADDKDCDIVLAFSETVCVEKLPYPWRDTLFEIGTKTGEYCFRHTRQGTTCDSIVYLYLNIDSTCNKPCKEGGVLINGLCWAECNVDEPGTFAASPEAYGMYYQWNRKKGWPYAGDVTGWDGSEAEGDSWEAINDPCPKGWRVPTMEEMHALADDSKVTHEYTHLNGIYGSKFTDHATGNTIFLPTTGLRDSEMAPENENKLCYYWSSSPYKDEGSAKCLLTGTIVRSMWISRHYGSPVRCITGHGALECEDIERDTSVTICAKDLPYPFADTVFQEGTVSGTYIFRRPQVHTSCDSIVYLNLTIQEILPLEFFGEICQGGNYTENDFNLQAVMRDTIVRDTIPTQRGCDSVRILHLTVYPKYDTIVYDTVCQGDQYHGHGFTLTDAETSQEGMLMRDRTAQSIHGCDSVIHLYLFVGKTYLFNLSREICQGDTVMWRGKQYDTQGTYEEPFTTVHGGCDSVYRLHLTVHPSPRLEFFGEVCHGEDYNEDGFFVPLATKDTVVRQELKTRWNCDSVRTLYLTVHPRYDTVVYDIVCQGDQYHGHGFTLTDAETSQEGMLMRDRTAQSIHGCDSVIHLYLFVGKTYLFETEREICQGDTVMWRGKQYDTQGTYKEPFTTVHGGCDSVYRLHLTVHPVYDMAFFGEVCQGKSYNEDGFIVPSATKDTIVRQELKTRWGCDSMRTLYLTVHPRYDTVVYDTVCQGDPYHGHGFTLTNAQSSDDGTPLAFHRTAQSIHGCDSVIHLYLFVGKTYLFETPREICQGDTVMWRGKQYDTQGTYEEPFTTVHGGCDSVYRLHLTVHPVYDMAFFGEVCQGKSYNEDGFFVPSATKDTVVRQELKTRWNCDSVRTLYLTVHPVYDTIVRDTVCQGDAYYRHGVSISHAQPSKDGKPAMYRHTYPSMHGCDSTVTLFLTVHPVSDTILYDAICRGDGYKNHGFSLDAAQFPKEGTYSFSRVEPNMHGCDSTIHLSLTVHPDYLFPRTEHICQGETFEFRDKVYDATGLYADTLATVHGCDSVYTLSLTVHPVYDVQLQGVLCEGEAFTRYGFDVREAGVHVLHLHSVDGCDSTVTLTLTEEKKVEGSIGFLLEDCTKHGYGFDFSPSIPVREWVWDMGDGTAYRTEEGYHRYADSGTYRVLLRTLTDNGCGNEFLHVQRVPPYLDRVTVHADRQVVDEEYPTVRFRAEVLGGMECEWDFGDGTTGKGSGTEHTYATTEARVYEVTLRVTNEDGCLTESTFDIEAVVFPKAINTFSPNGDGINDVFMAGFRIEIMNRNGLKIYSGGNGWDGTYKGGEAKEDTYFYRVTFRTATGERTKTGYVNLIR